MSETAEVTEDLGYKDNRFQASSTVTGGTICKLFARQNYFQLEKCICPVAVGETAEVTEALGYKDNRFQASSTVTGR